MKKPPQTAAASTAPVLTPGLRRYLYLTAAVTGAVIMVVEILGAKMLSPFVGTSHFVWTAQIAVTLVALAAGYYAGGRLADRTQNLRWLYLAILIAAGDLVLSVLICEPVAYRCLDLNLAVGSLLASAILFFVPLAMLAMTGPFLVRVIASSIPGVGGVVGRLTAVGTLGSFAGTMCIGYLLLPLLPNSLSMYLTAAGLALMCAIYFLFYHRRSGLPAAGAIVLMLGIAGLAGRGQHRTFTYLTERFHGNSFFGQIQILERTDGRLRIFANDNLIQNTYDPASRQSASTFTYALAALARGYATNFSDVLCIGMGVGIVPMEFARIGARVDVIEINPAILPVAQKFFDLEPERLRIVIDDGRHFLNRCERQYDAVVLDAFLGDSSPSHLMTREAFGSIQRVLRPGGVLVINAFGEATGEHDFFIASLGKTLKAVFTSVRAHADEGQVYFVATDRSNPVLTGLPDPNTFHPFVRRRAENAFATLIETNPEHGLILTDDFNPVEFYDAHNREQVRRAYALGARRW